MKSVVIYMGLLPAERTYWTTFDRVKYLWISQLLAHFKTVKFVLLSDNLIPAFFTDYKNVEKLTIGEHKLKYWAIYRHYHFKLSAILKERKCDVFISLTGILPKRYKGKCCLVLPDSITNVEEERKRKPLDDYRSRFLEKAIVRADWIFTLSDYTKQYLLSTFQRAQNKIRVAPPIDHTVFRPLGWEDREEIKEKFTEHREYLLYIGDFTHKDSFINLLRGFSILKKKMSSGMVLVLAGDNEKTFKKFSKLVRTYHFRKDLIFTGALTEELQTKLMGGAYACIIPSAEVDFSSPVVEMIQCHTPVVTPEGSVHEAYAKHGGLSFEPGNYEDLGDKLCTLYRNEDERSALIHNAEKMAEKQLSNTIITVFSDIIA